MGEIGEGITQPDVRFYLNFQSADGVREVEDTRFPHNPATVRFLETCEEATQSDLAEITRAGKSEQHYLMRAASRVIGNNLPYDVAATYFNLDGDTILDGRPTLEIGYNCQEHALATSALLRRIGREQSLCQYAAPIRMRHTNPDMQNQGHVTTFVPGETVDDSYFVEPGGNVYTVRDYMKDEYWSPTDLRWLVYHQQKNGSRSAEWINFDPLDRDTWPIPKTAGKFSPLARGLSRLSAQITGKPIIDLAHI